MRFLFLLTSLGFSTVFADQGLDQFKQSFNGIIQTANQEFDKAAEMKPVMLTKGTEISKEDCEEAKVMIRANYKVDPFDVIYEGGSATNSMCGDKYKKNFIQNVAGKSNLGLPYSFVIQLGGWYFSKESILNYFIDSNYRIVEIQGLLLDPKTGELFDYDITSVDLIGNVYSSVFTKNYNLVDKNIKGTQTIEWFFAVDGRYPYPLVRNTVKNKTDPTKDYQVIMIERSDKNDWDDFFLPITHAWSGGFYDYAGKQYRTNHYSSHLTIKYRGGREYCAYGWTKEDQKWSQFPTDDKSYYNCFNY